MIAVTQRAHQKHAPPPFAEGQRGFTGHEHLAELGIIHMNGRLYDPVLGRFLQADPIIQAPHNAQSHNRYSYVMNNPLSMSDPSGFSAWTQCRSTIFAIVAAVTMQYNLMPLALGATSFSAMTLGQQFVTVVASGFASGGIQGGNIQSALQGAFTAGVTFGLAEAFGLHGGASFGPGKHLGQVALHSAMGCASSAAAGGSCKSGAISGGVSAFASPMLAGDGKSFSAGRLVGRTIIGAVASRLSGGKAENGAMTAAFSYLLNEAADRIVDKANASNPLRVFKQAMLDFWDSGKYNASIGVGAQFNLAGGAAGDIGLTFNVDPIQSGIRSVDDVCLYANRCVSFGPVVGGAVGIVGQLQTGHSSTGSRSQGGVFFVGGSGIVGEGQLQIGQDGNASAGRGLVGIGVMVGGAFTGCRVSYYCASTAKDWFTKKD